jgi:hypothetical protein
MSQKSADPRKGRNTLDGKYILRGKVGWSLLVLMGVCCGVIAFLPDRWHLAQVVAAMLQMFCTGVVAALYLPIWQQVEPDVDEPTSEIRQPPSLE